MIAKLIHFGGQCTQDGPLLEFVPYYKGLSYVHVRSKSKFLQLYVIAAEYIRRTLIMSLFT